MNIYVHWTKIRICPWTKVNCFACETWTDTCRCWLTLVFLKFSDMVCFRNAISALRFLASRFGALCILQFQHALTTCYPYISTSLYWLPLLKRLIFTYSVWPCWRVHINCDCTEHSSDNQAPSLTHSSFWTRSLPTWVPSHLVSL